jgi:two-component system response regulator FixJ
LEYLDVSAEPQIVVWIVDDAESVRKSIAAVLETADIAVRDYGSAAEFLADFRTNMTGCLVVDHHMPDMTGLDLLIHLREQNIDMPVIVVTGQGDAVLKQRVEAAGAVTMLHKPVNGNELGALIKKVMPKKG